MKKVKPLTDKELEDLRTRNNENRKMNGSTAVLVDRLIATIDQLKLDLELADDEIRGWAYYDYEQRITD